MDHAVLDSQIQDFSASQNGNSDLPQATKFEKFVERLGNSDVEQFDAFFQPQRARLEPEHLTGIPSDFKPYIYSLDPLKPIPIVEKGSRV